MKETDKRSHPNLRPVPTPARRPSGSTPERQPGAAEAGQPRSGVAVRMSASPESEVPVFANFVTVNAGPGTVMIEFGFIDPTAITNASQLALAGKALPHHLDGRLAVRVALGYDTLANLHKRITQALVNMGKGKAGAGAVRQRPTTAPQDKPN